MTMLSFRVGTEQAEAADKWADRLKIHRSDLLREALRAHLNRLAAEADARRIAVAPDDESPLALIADWGPAEDWSDWADAAR